MTKKKRKFDKYLNMCLETLRLIAAEAGQQKDRLPDYVSIPDDIATTFGDMLAIYPKPALERRVSAEFSKKIDELSDAFDAIQAEGEEIWTDQALMSHPKWQRTREIARAALSDLDAIFELPADI